MQKQIYLHFAEAKYLRRSQRLRKSRGISAGYGRVGRYSVNRNIQSKNK
ncbi:hypothetical protein ALIPUT_01994 [Alistipes putredinis DSM 17216]|uniref:Uncharacterized protein n=1 Tax=Alistipes putredinis DSM 17216 TaxID=445970 RepID=B0MXY2_9BACT|nr:hypothetical protein ALIPUT_01994 [Alistipes putredinis DSM 17216]